LRGAMRLAEIISRYAALGSTTRFGTYSERCFALLLHPHIHSPIPTSKGTATSGGNSQGLATATVRSAVLLAPSTRSATRSLGFAGYCAFVVRAAQRRFGVARGACVFLRPALGSRTLRCIMSLLNLELCIAERRLLGGQKSRRKSVKVGESR